MKKGLTEIVFILDRSGSMRGLEEDTIGGFNSMLEKQKDVEGEAIVSTVLFDDTAKVIHDRAPLKSIRPLTKKDYYVGGSTALLDAMGNGIRHINSVQKALPESERPEKTMFIITTDGQENSSREYSFEKIKKMVEKKQDKKQWQFLFLGANIDAIGTAAGLGIRADRAVNYHADHAGTAMNYGALCNAVTAVRGAECAKAMDDCLLGWDSEIKEDYKRRKNRGHKLWSSI